MIASGSELTGATIERIQAGNWAPGALRDAIGDLSAQFKAMADPYLRERSHDIDEIGRRIMTKLLEHERPLLQYPEATILVGEDLSLSDLMMVPAANLRGLISGSGSAYSHLAILSRALSIPALLGLGTSVPIRELDHRPLIVDGYGGTLYIEPKQHLRNELERLIRQEEKLGQELKSLQDLAAVTTDGVHISLLTNAGISADLSHSAAAGSAGVGLYRTELSFMSSERFLTEQEQFVLYRDVLAKIVPNSVTFRTLDIGGDKPLPYWPIQENSPFLGWRGIRISLDQPQLFLGQVRALMRASEGLDNLKLLLPMVNCLEDVDAALVLIKQARNELVQEGVALGTIPIGVMIEVPEALYQLEALARRVDFLSIGSNDLTQYLLAVDRNNDRVERWYRPFHPAVLQAIHSIAKAGQKYGLPVSICGEVAGNPAMVILLLGMGIDTLSLSAGDLSRVKMTVRALNLAQAQSILKQALTLEKTDAIESMLERELIALGLGGLIRPGSC